MLEKLFFLVDKLKSKGKYWTLTAVFWISIFLFIYFVFSVSVLKVPYSSTFMIGVLFLTFIGFYTIVFGFKRSIFTGIVFLFLTLLLYLYYTYYFFYYVSLFDKTTFFGSAIERIGHLRFWQVPFSGKVFYFTYTMSLFHLAPPLGIKLVYELLKQFYQTQKLREENLKLEISYLHAQINPHFLLNTLTAIYNMVMDNPKAAKSIETLSGLLYYSLYDTGSEKVLLDKEIDFIKNYVKLARIRLNRNKKLKLSITGSSKDLTIAPLILVNLVENCIKHGLHRTSGAAEAEVAIFIDNGTIYLDTYNRAPDSSEITGGIGLTNTRRRLSIYYHGNHDLRITDKNLIYQVNLRINLIR